MDVSSHAEDRIASVVVATVHIVAIAAHEVVVTARIEDMIVNVESMIDYMHPFVSAAIDL